MVSLAPSTLSCVNLDDKLGSVNVSALDAAQVAAVVTKITLLNSMLFNSANPMSARIFGLVGPDGSVDAYGLRTL